MELYWLKVSYRSISYVSLLILFLSQCTHFVAHIAKVMYYAYSGYGSWNFFYLPLWPWTFTVMVTVMTKGHSQGQSNQPLILSSISYKKSSGESGSWSCVSVHVYLFILPDPYLSNHQEECIHLGRVTWDWCLFFLNVIVFNFTKLGLLWCQNCTIVTWKQHI